jgi:chitinase
MSPPRGAEPTRPRPRGRHRLAAAAVVAVLAGYLVGGCDQPLRTAPAAAPAEPFVAGYFTAWGGDDKRRYTVKDVADSGAAGVLTHLLYAFGSVAGGRCASADRRADQERVVTAAESVDGRGDARTGGLRGTINQLRKLKASHPRLKVIWSFGGWNGSAGFTAAAKDPAAFAASCHDLVEDPRWSDVFDGIDIDWEYPNACGRRCDASGPDAMGRLTEALRSAFGPGSLVTAAITGDGGTGGPADATDYARAVAPLDWATIMTYDYFGTGSPRGPTAPHSALTGYPGIPRRGATAEAAVAKFTGMGIPARKLLLGIGFYGRGWTGVTSAEPGSTASGAAAPRDYRVLRETCPPTGRVGDTAYAYCGDEWWAYDTPETIGTKMAYVRRAGLGGAFAWELAGDSADGELIAAIAAGVA